MKEHSKRLEGSGVDPLLAAFWKKRIVTGEVSKKTMVDWARYYPGTEALLGR